MTVLGADNILFPAQTEGDPGLSVSLLVTVFKVARTPANSWTDRPIPSCC